MLHHSEVIPLQKCSHKLLASSLLRSQQGFGTRRYELAFLFGSFQPDCNPFTYLRGIRSTHKLQGHNFTNSQSYINSRIQKLQNRRNWTLLQYYTLGKLTHYLADAFTYPHNENYSRTMADHCRYENALRLKLAEHLSRNEPLKKQLRQDLTSAIDQLHCQYMESKASLERDIRYILEATTLLMAGCAPRSA